MRIPAISSLLFVITCASPQSSVPRTSTVFIAPTVHPGYAENNLAHALVAEFDRSLRLGIDMVHVDAAEDADDLFGRVLFALVS